MEKIKVIGAGLAGCEAAWQIAEAGIKVELYDMKPRKYSPAHKSPFLCELVCSNSLKSNETTSASGLLKEELRKLNSLVVGCADKCRIPAGGALAVDREKFSMMVTDKIKSHKNISFIEKEVRKIDLDGNIKIIATGPLTSEPLAEHISEICGGSLSFFDAAAPIVTAESIDMDNAFFASRYDKGNGEDYLNCPMDRDEYEAFYSYLINAERAPIKDFDVLAPKVYEGCMPVEVLALRGKDALRYGPMKPVGLKDPKTEKRPYAVVQLRRENLIGNLYNMVGFQTNLKFKEQKTVFGLIPALKNAEFVRFGVMHRNTFIDSPRILDEVYSMKNNSSIFFAGQITGTEGYMESVSSGIVAGVNAVRKARGVSSVIFPKETMIGALASYISDKSIKNFQPMGANFGIIPDFPEKIRDKRLKKEMMAERALKLIDKVINDENNS